MTSSVEDCTIELNVMLDMVVLATETPARRVFWL